MELYSDVKKEKKFASSWMELEKNYTNPGNPDPERQTLHVITHIQILPSNV